MKPPQQCCLHAMVGGRGEVLLGENVVADGYAERLVRVVTHAHSDHIQGLSRSLRRSLYVAATPVTFEFLSLLDRRVPEEKMLPLNYDSPVTIEDEKLTLAKARHIAGSAQVLVESPEYRVGYTGDFKLPGTPPLRDLDVLVVDATYGSPRLQRRWTDWEALSALIALIDEKIRMGPVWVYGFNGKIQEIMVELRVRGVEYPFLAEPLSIELARISSREYGVSLGDLRAYLGGDVDESAVVFIHSSKTGSKLRFRGTHVRLTGWEVNAVVRMVSENLYNVSFSDHATFREVVEYVREAAPRQVIVDGYRGRDAWFTAAYIEKRLGIPAVAMPVGVDAARR